jgi:polysaccharide deacetylase family protein (PEP-CTERM system associated)
MTCRKIKILTFDIEDWFHLLDFQKTKHPSNWHRFESRIYSNMDKIFHILENTNQKATFFCLGWIAKKYPDVIKEIVSRGYELGSHSNLHQLVYDQGRNDFKDDLECSIKTLEDLIGKKITFYRAPGFSITENSKWAFELLYEQGIEIDCSVFPTHRSHGGFPSFLLPKPTIIHYNGISLKEFPINYHSILSQHIVYSGGGFFRLTPYYFIKKWSNKTNYVMTYFHPRDFDPEQPLLEDLSVLRKFKSYVGLKHAQRKLETWLKDEEFMDVSTANSVINWDDSHIIRL